MTLYDTNKVDNIGISKKDSSALYMFIHDSFDWKEENEHLYLLQEKVNAYFAFIQDKQYEEYGYNNINHFIIQIDFKYDIPVSCLNLLENFAEVMEPFNTKIRIELHEND